MKKIYIIILMLLVAGTNSYAVSTAPLPDQVQVRLVQFYPNPAISSITFEFARSIDKSYTLVIYNFIGKKVNEMAVNSSKISLTLDNNYYRGLYVFQLRDKTGQIVESGKFQVVK